MELKLNIYNGKEIVKTYSENDTVLKTGVCEDILKIVDIDKLTSGKLSDEKMAFEIIKIVAKSFSKFKPFLQDVFIGLTDEEYRNTSIQEVAKVIISIVKSTIQNLYSIGADSKN